MKKAGNKSYLIAAAMVASSFVSPPLSAQIFSISTNFENASARVLALNAATQTVRITPAGDAARGWPNWWYLRVDNIDTGKTVILEVVAGKTTVPADDARGSKELGAGWSLPAQASVSFDGLIWTHTAAGEKKENSMLYRVRASSRTIWLAWGPPFTLSDAAAFVKKITGAYPFAESFTLCTSREGRNVPALKISEGSKPAATRPVVWIDARQHAWEVGGTWVGVGLIEWLVGESTPAKWLRQNAEIYFVPVMDADHVATGDGGKNALPQDHNLDWTATPHWPEVAASQQYILSLAKQGRMSVFLDLHNPAPGNRQQTAYVIDKAYMQKEAEPRKLRFVELLIGEFGDLKQNVAKPPDSNPALFHQVSVPWVLEHANPQTIAFCIETPWNIPSGTAEGYRVAGQKLGSAVEKLLRETPGY
jgi:hypothetical protein